MRRKVKMVVDTSLMEPDEAANAFVNNKSLVYYRTQLDGIVSILAQLRIDGVTRVAYGFIYLGRACAPKFVTSSPTLSVRLATQQGRQLYVVDSLKEIVEDELH